MENPISLCSQKAPMGSTSTPIVKLWHRIQDPTTFTLLQRKSRKATKEITMTCRSRTGYRSSILLFHVHRKTRILPRPQDLDHREAASPKRGLTRAAIGQLGSALKVAHTHAHIMVALYASIHLSSYRNTSAKDIANRIILVVLQITASQRPY